MGLTSVNDPAPYLQQLHKQLGPRLLASENLRGDAALILDREGLRESFQTLKEDPELKYDFLTDITAVDYWKKKEPRFELVYHVTAPGHRRRLRVKVPVPENDPVVESLTPLWPGANFLEREVWDLFGIRFAGHPDLRRILLYEEFQGHPLRKDYPVNLWQPRVPERHVEGTFVDEASRIKLLQLKKNLGNKISPAAVPEIKGNGK